MGDRRRSTEPGRSLRPSGPLGFCSAIGEYQSERTGLHRARRDPRVPPEAVDGPRLRSGLGDRAKASIPRRDLLRDAPASLAAAAYDEFQCVARMPFLWRTATATRTHDDHAPRFEIPLLAPHGLFPFIEVTLDSRLATLPPSPGRVHATVRRPPPAIVEMIMSIIVALARHASRNWPRVPCYGVLRPVSSVIVPSVPTTCDRSSNWISE